MRRVRVNMGIPIFELGQIPTLLAGSPPVDVPIEVGDDRSLAVTALSMGNPHAVAYVDDVTGFPLESLGPLIENHRAFPRRVNVHVVEVKTSGEVRMRTGARLGHHAGMRHGSLCRLRGRRLDGADQPYLARPISPAAIWNSSGLATGPRCS